MYVCSFVAALCTGTVGVETCNLYDGTEGEWRPTYLLYLRNFAVDKVPDGGTL